MKVIMCAYACEPGQGSEPAVGWHWAQEAAAAGHEVWVLTRRNNREPIEAAFAVGAQGSRSLHFVYLDLPRPLTWLKRNLGHGGLLAYYYLWQVKLMFVARRLHRKVGFDLAHHVTFVNDTMPSGLCGLRIPFVWGPVGGSTHTLPKDITLELPLYARLHEQARRVIQSGIRTLDPFACLTRRRAQLILVYTHEALDGLSGDERRRARAVTHIGVSSDEPPHRTNVPSRGGPRGLRILTGGRLVHWKGIDLLIEGIAMFRRAEQADVRLVVTGTGRYEASLRHLASRSGLGTTVDFVGRLPTRRDVFKVMEACDLFALPTLRDGPPLSILEAMAFGLPVLCLDLGATSELVPPEAGFKIDPRSRAFVVSEIARICSWAVDHPDELAEMGLKGRRHSSKHHDWSRIRAEIEQAYLDVTRAGDVRTSRS